MRFVPALCAASILVAACGTVPDLVFVGEEVTGGDAASDGAGGSDASVGADGSADVAALDGPAQDGGRDAIASTTCPSGHPAGADGCCGQWPCVKEVCQNCGDCTQAGCSAGQVCCPQYNGGGKYKGVSCSSLPCP